MRPPVCVVSAFVLWSCAAVPAPDAGVQDEVRPRTTRSRAGHPTFTGDFSLGAGPYTHETHGTSADDTQPAGFVRLRGEWISRLGIGGGLDLEGMTSDDDLFADQGVMATEANRTDLFLHFTWRPTAGSRFRAPLRVGPYFQFVELDEQRSEDSVSWSSAGIRIAAEPEWVAVRHRSFEWSLYGGGYAGVMGTRAEVDTATTFGHFDSEGSSFGVEGGTRFKFGPFLLGLYWFGRWNQIDRSEMRRGVSVEGFDSFMHGLALSFGARV